MNMSQPMNQWVRWPLFEFYLRKEIFPNREPFANTIKLTNNDQFKILQKILEKFEKFFKISFLHQNFD